MDRLAPKEQTKPEKDTMENLRERFARFMDPRNHYLVPIKWPGFGESQEVIDAVRAFEAQAR